MTEVILYCKGIPNFIPKFSNCLHYFSNYSYHKNLLQSRKLKKNQLELVRPFSSLAFSNIFRYSFLNLD